MNELNPGKHDETELAWLTRWLDWVLSTLEEQPTREAIEVARALVNTIRKIIEREGY